MALNGLLNFGVFFNARTNILRVAKDIATGTSQISKSFDAVRKQRAGDPLTKYEQSKRDEQLAVGRGLIAAASSSSSDPVLAAAARRASGSSEKKRPAGSRTSPHSAATRTSSLAGTRAPR